MNRLIISISLIALISCTKPVVVKKNERFYQAKHCNSLNGQIEFKLNDNKLEVWVNQNLKKIFKKVV